MNLLLLSLFLSFCGVVLASEGAVGSEERIRRQNQMIWGQDTVPDHDVYRTWAKKHIEENYHHFDKASDIFLDKARDFMRQEVLEQEILPGVFGYKRRAMVESLDVLMNHDGSVNHMQAVADVLDSRGTIKPSSYYGRCSDCQKWLWTGFEGGGLYRDHAVWGFNQEGLYPVALWLEGLRIEKILSVMPEPCYENDAWSVHRGKFFGYSGAFFHDRLHLSHYMERRFLLNTFYKSKDGQGLGDVLEKVALDMIDAAKGDEDRRKTILFCFNFLHEVFWNDAPIVGDSLEDFLQKCFWYNIGEFFMEIKTVFPDEYPIFWEYAFLMPFIDRMKGFSFDMETPVLRTLQKETRKFSAMWLGEEKESMCAADVQGICEDLSEQGLSFSPYLTAFDDDEFQKSCDGKVYGILVPEYVGHTALAKLVNVDSDPVVILLSKRHSGSKDACGCVCSGVLSRCVMYAAASNKDGRKRWAKSYARQLSRIKQ